MLCSGCGKDIPFHGQVCPYCQRDKSKDQEFTVTAVIFGLIGGVIGYFLFNIWAGIGGFFLGCITAAALSAKPTSKAPEVRLEPSSAPQQDAESVSSKLTQLKLLYEQDLLTHEEYAAKKAELLAKF